MVSVEERDAKLTPKFNSNLYLYVGTHTQSKQFSLDERRFQIKSVPHSGTSIRTRQFSLDAMLKEARSLAVHRNSYIIREANTKISDPDW